MKKIILKGVAVLLTLALAISAVGCQENNEDSKNEGGKAVSSEEAGMSTDANDKNDTFKPSEYTLKAKKEYIYEYLGLKFKLADKIRKAISNKKIAMYFRSNFLVCCWYFLIF